MKILVTADLHYDVPRSRDAARRLAAEAVSAGGDALVLAGDTAGADLAVLKECLNLFAGFPGRKLLVPGNHCLWCHNGESSLDRYERLIPEAAAECGFGVLDHEPVVLEEGEQNAGGTPTTRAGGQRVGLAGSIGWYDYSFADEELALPTDFYRDKVSPGAAAYLGGYEELLERHRGGLTERHRNMGVQWMDGRRVKLGMTDGEFTHLLCEKLRGQLAELSERADRIVVVTHHLPFGELVPSGRPDRFAFAAAYMGAGSLGEVILAFPKVVHVYCGHSHWPGRTRVGRATVVNVGSTYIQKKLEVLRL